MSENIKFINDQIAQELNCEYYRKDMERGKKKVASSTNGNADSPALTAQSDIKPKYRIVDFDTPRDKEMAVFTLAKKLSEYLFVITEKSPKKLRWSIIGRLQNNSVELIENLYRANFEHFEVREKFQKEALVKLSLTDYYSETAFQMKAITLKQVKIIATQTAEIKKMLIGWIKSNKLPRNY